MNHTTSCHPRCIYQCLFNKDCTAEMHMHTTCKDIAGNELHLFDIDPDKVNDFIEELFPSVKG